MKKCYQSVLAIFLCLCTLCSIVTFSVGAVYGTTPTTEKKPFFSAAFDEFTNFAIDFIHRGIVLLRYPWNHKVDKKVDMDQFVLTFQDDFDKDTLSPVWGHRFPGIRKGCYWDKEQTSVRDGNLVIRTEYKADGEYGPGYYSDRVDTLETWSQQYGYFEARCKLPAAQGMWSAFWLSTRNIKDYVPGEQGTEIDIFESPLYYRGALGLNNNLVSSNLHYGGYSLGHRYRNVTVAKANNPYTEFNTYGMEWNEDGYIFYINGEETGRSNFGGVSKVPEFLILSCEVDGVNAEPHYGWSGKITWNKHNEIPADFLVDYVRVYQYKDLVK